MLAALGTILHPWWQQLSKGTEDGAGRDASGGEISPRQVAYGPGDAASDPQRGRVGDRGDAMAARVNDGDDDLATGRPRPDVIAAEVWREAEELIQFRLRYRRTDAEAGGVRWLIEVKGDCVCVRKDGVRVVRIIEHQSIHKALFP